MEVQRTLLEGGFRWNQLCSRVATITAAHDPYFRVAYFAFPSREAAKEFWTLMTETFRCRCQIREAERFKGWAIECKVWGLKKEFIRAIVALLQDKNL